jgi:hypothetical protein
LKGTRHGSERNPKRCVGYISDYSKSKSMNGTYGEWLLRDLRGVINILEPNIRQTILAQFLIML